MASTARQNVYSIIKGGGGGEYSIIKRDRQTYRERRDRQVGGGGGQREREWNTVLLRKREKDRETDRQRRDRQTDRGGMGGGGGGERERNTVLRKRKRKKVPTVKDTENSIKSETQRTAVSPLRDANRWREQQQEWGAKNSITTQRRKEQHQRCKEQYKRCGEQY